MALKLTCDEALAKVPEQAKRQAEAKGFSLTPFIQWVIEHEPQEKQAVKDVIQLIPDSVLDPSVKEAIISVIDSLPG